MGQYVSHVRCSHRQILSRCQVDTDALGDGLADKRIAGPALDVYEDEPPPEQHPVRNLDNMILTLQTALYALEFFRQHHG
jgi:lactate dehydrogenase-like 2-hydroxyacid dehydrogenase